MLRIELDIDSHDPGVLPLREAWEDAARRHYGQHDALASAALERYRAISQGPMPAGVREPLSVVPSLARLLTTSVFRTDAATRDAVAGALGYFVDPDDLIPDEGHHFGFLDDALVLKLALDEARHDWFAWCDYSDYVAAHPEETGIDRDTWMQHRRARLTQELRRRNDGGYAADGRREAGFVERYAPSTDGPNRFGVR